MDQEKSLLAGWKEHETVRNRPQNFFDDNGDGGVYKAIREIIDNAVDEASEGHCDKITIKMIEGEVTVQDNGRGIPILGYNEEMRKFDWELAFTTLYGSGKHDNKMYKKSAGLSGVGLSACQYASEYMYAESTRSGNTNKLWFEKGQLANKEFNLKEGKENGTTIRFKLDKEVFKGCKRVDMKGEDLISDVIKIAMLNSSLSFHVEHDDIDKPYDIRLVNGIADYIESYGGNAHCKTQLFDGRTYGSDGVVSEKYDLQMQFGFKFASVGGIEELYHNSKVLSEGGVTKDAMEDAFEEVFNQIAVKEGKITKGDPIIWKDINSLLICVGSTQCEGYLTWFKSQTKLGIKNPFIGSSFKDFCKESLYSWVEEDLKSALKILEAVLLNKKAREESIKVSTKILKQLNQGLKNISNIPDTFKDCKRRGKGAEVYFVEGLSAMGGVKNARNSDFQAVMPLRGKIINAQKNTVTRVLESDVAVSAITIINCGIETSDSKYEGLPGYDEDKLNYEKVMCCPDADVDGLHIAVLFIVLIYNVAPKLIRDGHLYIVKTPLFVVSCGRERIYAYDDMELNQLKDELDGKGKKYTIQRLKGLGECSAEVLSETAMNPKTRRLVQVEYRDDEKETIAKVMETFVGNDIEGRKREVFAYLESRKDERISI